MLSLDFSLIQLLFLSFSHTQGTIWESEIERWDVGELWSKKKKTASNGKIENIS